MSFPPLPPGSVRRMSCKCGCGRWWLEPRLPSRPHEFATDECRQKFKSARNHAYYLRRKRTEAVR